MCVCMCIWNNYLLQLTNTSPLLWRPCLSRIFRNYSVGSEVDSLQARGGMYACILRIILYSVCACVALVVWVWQRFHRRQMFFFFIHFRRGRHRADSGKTPGEFFVSGGVGVLGGTLGRSAGDSCGGGRRCRACVRSRSAIVLRKNPDRYHHHHHHHHSLPTDQSLSLCRCV